jgi:hypothetical protein
MTDLNVGNIVVEVLVDVGGCFHTGIMEYFMSCIHLHLMQGT